MGEERSIDELSELTGVTADVLHSWLELGLILHTEEGRFAAPTTERVRLIQFAQRRGIEPKDIAAASASQGDVFANYLGLTGHSDRQGHGIEEVADHVGLDDALVRRIWTIVGVGEQVEGNDDDIEALVALARAISAGIPAEALIQLVRVFVDTLERLAEAEVRLFHFHVHERLRTEGLSGAQLVAATNAVSEPATELVEPTLLYFHRRAFERASREDLLLHLVEDLTPPGPEVGRMPLAVLFVDLTSFTTFTEVMGDVAAANVVERFSDLVRDAAGRYDGRVVKQIGDEFMLVFSQAQNAAACGVEIRTMADSEAQFPGLHMGAHFGTALYREGDYVGSDVNLAARVAAEAKRGEFLVTDAIRAESLGLELVVFRAAGTRQMKGFAGEFDLYEVTATSDPTLTRYIDPVCRMEFTLEHATTRLRWRGEVRCRLPVLWDHPVASSMGP
ncbi:MAG: MerR family transcriptional regulator, partial [Acidimicrobiales bacterium]|nr:MerR family transcriptional regulator [Acidimicrobiales bacterium]